MGEPAKKRSRREWNEDETQKLINFWMEKIEDLRKTKRNSSVYEDISASLKQMNVVKSAVEIKLKIKNLTTKFRNEKKLVGSSGGSPSEWKYYTVINEIIGNFPCNDDSLIEETIVIDISDYNNLVEDGFFDDPGASSSSSSSISSITPPSSVSAHSSRPRKIAAIQEELLTQITRGNDCIENYCHQAEKYQGEHLKIMKESLKMQTMWYNFFTNNNNINSNLNN